MIKKNNLTNLSDVDTILFDIDHTMIYLEDDGVIVKEILEDMDIPYKDSYGSLLCDAIVSAASENVITLETLESKLDEYMPFIKENGIDVVHFRERVFETELKHVRPVLGIREVIEELYEEYSLLCFTDWFYDLAVRKVDKIGLLSKITSIISSQNRYSKKDLVSFRTLLCELKKEPEQVIMIGDSKTDIHSAKVGIQSILVDYNNDKKSDVIEESTAVITESKDIIKLLHKGDKKHGTR